MTTVLITYDVDDVQAWLASPTRTASTSRGDPLRRRLAGGLPGRHGDELGAGPRAELGADVRQVPLDRAG